GWGGWCTRRTQEAGLSPPGANPAGAPGLPTAPHLWLPAVQSSVGSAPPPAAGGVSPAMNGGGNGRAGSAAIGGGVVTGAPSDDDGVSVTVGGSASPGGGGACAGLFVLSLRLPNSKHACGRNHVGDQYRCLSARRQAPRKTL